MQSTDGQRDPSKKGRICGLLPSSSTELGPSYFSCAFLWERIGGTRRERNGTQITNMRRVNRDWSLAIVPLWVESILWSLTEAARNIPSRLFCHLEALPFRFEKKSK